MGFPRTICLFASGAAMLIGLAGPVVASAQAIRIVHAKGSATVPAVPAAIAVYDLATLDNLHAIGVEAVARVPMGPDGKGNFPPYLNPYADARYRNIGTLFEPDIAALQVLKPDLIVIGRRSAKQYDALSGIAPTIDMSSPNKDLAALTTGNVCKLGQALGHGDQAEKRIAAFEAQAASLHA
ncbi:ABC transporter substrate-binding protein [Sphingobium sp.]|uniref:ABC transporter substrate-binding protein n=1 Tax=Sphingobium sp. TaxID=1912891 RepID=UPI003B39FDB2